MTEKWIKDTGLIFTLIFIVLGLGGNKTFLIISIALLLTCILVPKLLYPLAFLWFKLVELLNLIVPKIFFGLVFLIVIVPIGLCLRMIKGDRLLISTWRNAKTTFVERNHLFSKGDLEAPY